MRRGFLLGVAAFSSLGCFAGDLVASGLVGIASVPAAAAEHAEAQHQGEVDALMRLSRDEAIEQYDDPSAPACHVTTRRTGTDTWELRTCHETWACRPQGERYACSAVALARR